MIADYGHKSSKRYTNGCQQPARVPGRSGLQQNLKQDGRALTIRNREGREARVMRANRTDMVFRKEKYRAVLAPNSA